MMLATAVAGGAPVWIAERINGPKHLGEIVHAGWDAIYIESLGDIIGVISRHAVASPCTISTRLESVGDLYSGGQLPKPGEQIPIGAGFIEFPQSQLRIGRFTDFKLPRQLPFAAERIQDRINELTGTEIQDSELPTTITNQLVQHPNEALLNLLGYGSGLTPYGDDVVSGYLATLLANDDPCAINLRKSVNEIAPIRTTSLSATLLKRAGEGEVLPAFAEVFERLINNDENVMESISKLLKIGHTSGAGMFHGFRLALEHITKRSCDE